MLHMFAYKNFF